MAIPSPQPLHRIVDLIDPEIQQLLDLSVEEARARLLSREPEAVAGIRGSFALVAREGERVCLARSLDRPLRYFLAKEKAGPMLVVAERIDQIRALLEAEGYGSQFHPSYTRMVPAHHVTEIRLVGCPDPNPLYRRFFDPPKAVGGSDLDALGAAYIGAVKSELRSWLAVVAPTEPLGVLFSGGIDSGAVLLCLYRTLLEMGQSPSRLKAFTLAVEGGGGDLEQARAFLRATGLEMLGEEIAVPAAAIDPLAAVEVIEDYKPRDVECAAVVLALAAALRERYPGWRYLVDGDGGDENWKDYPIEENPELTIRSVVSNRMLYQEGWGVEAIKHSLTFSGGLSRGMVRGYAPLRRHGFLGFSPLMRPAVIAAAEAAPFAELSAGSHERLYALKGEAVRRGIAQHTGIDMPIFTKRRFQEGAVPSGAFSERFGHAPERYRRHFLEVFQGR
ncbi:MAG TPA: asparagine synthase-related protein [Thermoanaerobaculia bacterium]|nr:asparagine synthase-related protein [Thermoanaerobaculia bacterium]